MIDVTHQYFLSERDKGSSFSYSLCPIIITLFVGTTLNLTPHKLYPIQFTLSIRPIKLITKRWMIIHIHWHDGIWMMIKSWQTSWNGRYWRWWIWSWWRSNHNFSLMNWATRTTCIKLIWTCYSRCIIKYVIRIRICRT